EAGRPLRGGRAECEPPQLARVRGGHAPLRGARGRHLAAALPASAQARWLRLDHAAALRGRPVRARRGRPPPTPPAGLAASPCEGPLRDAGLDAGRPVSQKASDPNGREERERTRTPQIRPARPPALRKKSWARTKFRNFSIGKFVRSCPIEILRGALGS